MSSRMTRAATARAAAAGEGNKRKAASAEEQQAQGQQARVKKPKVAQPSNEDEDEEEEVGEHQQEGHRDQEDHQGEGNHENQIRMELDFYSDDDPIDTDSEPEDTKRRPNDPKGKLSDAQKRAIMDERFDALGDELKTVAKNQPLRIAAAKKRSDKHVKRRQTGEKTVEDILRGMPTTESHIDGQVWTQEREDELQHELSQDQYLAYIRTSEMPDSNNRLPATWKQMYQLTKKFPVDVISPLQHLEYAAKSNAEVTLADGTVKPNPVWNQGFCQKFLHLVIGGPYNGNLNLVAMHLRYAKACSINDCRSVPLILPGVNHGDDFLRNMNRVLNLERDPRKSIPLLHKEVRDAMRAEGCDISWHSKMMIALEKSFYRRETPPLQENGVFTPYKITTEDLSNGYPMFNTARDASAILQNGRSIHPALDYNGVRRLHVVIYEQQMRQLKIREVRKQLEGAATSISRHSSIPAANTHGMDGSNVVLGDVASANEDEYEDEYDDNSQQVDDPAFVASQRDDEDEEEDGWIPEEPTLVVSQRDEDKDMPDGPQDDLRASQSHGVEDSESPTRNDWDNTTSTANEQSFGPDTNEGEEEE
ncbi:hypothetical protein M426DRAFT_24256 [Hypoxylon sp. CI-4A]|nr:hypothetical protein M426DRAFT_24256 [Hypoxylon sp. CI-4A]